MTYSTATDTSVDELQKVERRFTSSTNNLGSLGVQEGNQLLLKRSLEMQFAFTEVGLAIQRRNSFTKKLLTEIR